MEDNLIKFFSFKDKKVLIAGISFEIGKEIAKIFAKAEADLIIVNINEEGLRKSAREIRKHGCKSECFSLNLGDRNK